MTQNAMSHSEMSTFLRKLAQINSVTSVRNMEGLIQPIILGIVKSTRKGSNLRKSLTGVRALRKS